MSSTENLKQNIADVLNKQQIFVKRESSEHYNTSSVLTIKQDQDVDNDKDLHQTNISIKREAHDECDESVIFGDGASLFTTSNIKEEEIHIKEENNTKTFECTNLLICTVCGYKVHKRKILNAHMKSHVKEKPFTCTLCDYKCIRRSQLTSHVQTHTGEKPFSCKMCEFKAFREADLNRHLKTHSTDKPFSCTFCDYKGVQKYYLTEHMKVHTGSRKRLKCTDCDYTCFKGSNLNKHMRIHTGEKPYHCTFCNYKAAKKHHLDDHLKTHTMEKPLSCTICNYKCIKKSNLNRHIMTHSCEKPFACSFCNYKSIRRTFLTTHLKKHAVERRRGSTKPCECKSDTFEESDDSKLETISMSGFECQSVLPVEEIFVKMEKVDVEEKIENK